MTLSSRADTWSVGAQLVAGWIPFPTRQAAGRIVDDPTRARLDLGLMTFLASFGRGEGPGVEVQLPIGVIGRSDIVNGEQRDFGAGDLEARARFIGRAGPLRWQAMAGLGLPTGAYSARSGEVALLENARYLTLGRGTTWALLDADARFTLPARLGVFITATGRLALADARDGLRWGPELRGTVGVTFGPLVDRLSFALGLETQWRAQSSEIDPFTSERLPSVNTGGLWLTATPSVQVRVLDSLALFVAARVPVTQQTEGLQFIPAAGVFAGVAGSWGVIRAAPVADVAPAQGRVTVVDYWATWCAPCVKLKPVIDALEAREARVQVKRVDASNLSAEELGALVPGAAGLPIVEVFRADGSLAARLVGEEVFTVEAVVQEALR
ncbi:MAG: thioredoxin family protein [Myxococcales bacterium]|nr:thioredoxin family protein [Myxococcales bacterium]